MVLSTLFGVVAVLVTGIGPLAGALLGLAVGYSSSVVVINITRSRRRTTDKPTEDALIGWAILQDVTGVVLTGVLVALIGAGDRPWFATMGGLVAFVALAVGAAWLLPRLLRAVHDEKDIFLVVTIGAGLAVAGLGGIVFQIPMALAAFIAGLAISESHEAAEARRRILPFRDLFAILFFVSIGSLINPALFFDALPWLGLVLLLLVAGKMLVVYVLARIIRLRARPGQLTIGLGQIGEFSFVLASLGLATGVFDELIYTAILAAVAISIAASTIVVRLFPRPGPGPEPEARREVPVRGAS
jgi:CPA2 family monovalent cation:H+ antiporter-2